MGNICRSPLGEGIFAARARAAGLTLRVDSGGTHDYHVGAPPDPRSQAIAWARGIDISAQRARQVQREDFQRFDLILAADRGNLAWLQRMRPGLVGFDPAQAELALLLGWCGLGTIDVPDPYYGSVAGFAEVFDLLDSAATGLLQRLAKPA